MLTPSKNISHAAIAAQLRGHTMHIPSILGMFSSWPQGRQNPHYARLQLEISQIFDRVIPDQIRRAKYQKSDFALFCALWYPDADWDRLRLTGIFTAWAFIWDDTIDTNEHELSDNFEKACLFRRQSLAYVKYWLNIKDDEAREQEPITATPSFTYHKLCHDLLQSSNNPPTWNDSKLGFHMNTEPVAPSLGCGVFKEFGKEVCTIFNRDQRQRFYEQIEIFAKCTEIEQAERLAGHMPSREHYMEVRLGTTADFIYCCLEELAVETALPSNIMDSAAMRKCWDECNICIIIINDILSLKKEIVTDCVINLVPILQCEGKSLQQVIQDLIADLQDSRDRFDHFASELNSFVSGEEPLAAALHKYLNGLRTNVTGTADYSFYSKRYGITQYLKEDGTLDLTL
ncbi:Fc.00g095920.m01.CDS01 [Cosmosporella sp. VM-42]